MEKYKIEISKTDYFSKQFGRCSFPLETFEKLEKEHGIEAVKDRLYNMYLTVRQTQEYKGYYV